MDKKLNSVDDYIADFPPDIQAILTKIRSLVKKTAPDAVESMAYGMPGYKTNGKPLVYFAAYKEHIGFYATPTGHAKFAEELSRYKQGKGSVQFPLKEDMPYDLIVRIIEFRLVENSQKKGKNI